MNYIIKKVYTFAIWNGFSGSQPTRLVEITRATNYSSSAGSGVPGVFLGVNGGYFFQVPDGAAQLAEMGAAGSERPSYALIKNNTAGTPIPTRKIRREKQRLAIGDWLLAISYWQLAVIRCFTS